LGKYLRHHQGWVKTFGTLGTAHIGAHSYILIEYEKFNINNGVPSMSRGGYTIGA